MATVTEPRRAFDRADTQRRVGHPLQALRGYIRRYVMLEGAAIAVIFLALWFWIGLALDFGSFKLWAFDWIQELQVATANSETGASGNLDFYVRVAFLGALILCLVGLVAWKVFMRLFREFSDRSLALVLERKFRRELGDRLITAVELADPRENDKFGYSRQLIEKTIMEAADRVEKLPVKDVFNWGRLKLLWMWCGLMTLGMYLFVGLGSVVIGAISGSSDSPLNFPWRFNDVAGIWAERSLLLQDSYWPRNAYLQVSSFPGQELRVPRDEERPEVIVRAVQWVVADPDSPSRDGWRPLMCSDLSKQVGAEKLAQINIPSDYPNWVIDLSDLGTSVSANLIPPSWQGKSSGEIRAELWLGGFRDSFRKAGMDGMADEIIFPMMFGDRNTGAQAQRLLDAGSAKAIEELLDWHTWSVDKLFLQYDKYPAVRQSLRNANILAGLEAVKGELEGLASSASMSRRLRKLDVPQQITVYFRGDNTKIDVPLDGDISNKFAISLTPLKESARFTVRGDDYYTRSRKIALVPPPTLTNISVDKEEPAYLYYRLQGDQAPLKGKRQIFKKHPVSVDGDMSTIRVPIGTDLVLNAEADRPLKEGVHVEAPFRADEAVSSVPDSPINLSADGKSMTLQLERVVRTLDFFIAFTDRDNVKGRRRIKVVPVDDRPPEIVDFDLDFPSRKARFLGQPAPTSRGARLDGFLITPNALIPFKGLVKDDFGLTQVVWAYELEQAFFELQGSGASKAIPKNQKELDIFQRDYLCKIVSAFQFTPGNLGQMATARTYNEYVRVSIQLDLDKKAIPREAEKEIVMDRWKEMLQGRGEDEVSLASLEALLQKKPSGKPQLKEHQLKMEDGFDVAKYLSQVRPKVGEVQLHYLLELTVKAADNNVESGPNVGRPKSGYSFLVVSENEYLTQVAVDEEALLERLDKAIAKLQNAQTNMNEQVAKLGYPAPDLGLVSIRVEGSRKDMLEAATLCREMYADYSRILRELEVNRVRKDKIDNIREKIVEPLTEVNHSERGHFALAENSMQKLYQGLDDDIAAKRGDENRVTHLSNAKETNEHLTQLLRELNRISLAMSEGITAAKLEELIVGIEKEQRFAAEMMRRFYVEWVEHVLKKSIDGK